MNRPTFRGTLPQKQSGGGAGEDNLFPIRKQPKEELGSLELLIHKCFKLSMCMCLWYVCVVWYVCGMCMYV